MSQDRFGELVGLTAQQIGKYERGENSMRVEFFAKVMKMAIEQYGYGAYDKALAQFALAEAPERIEHIKAVSVALEVAERIASEVQVLLESLREAKPPHTPPG